MKRLRRSMLFLPGGNARYFEKALTSEADGLIIDLEDAVTVDKKAEVRQWTKNALLEQDFGGREKSVRINALDTEFGFDDIATIVEGKPDSLLIPKVMSPHDILLADKAISRAEQRAGLPPGTVEVLALVEIPEAIESAVSIARAHPRLTGLLFGAGDLTRETHGVVTEGRLELFYPMNRILYAARIAGIDALDSPSFNVRDAEGTEREALQAAQLGYDGKAAIHPAQIEPINRVFTPSADQIEYCVRVIDAYRQSEQEGKGATTVDGRIVEMPAVETAARVLGIAERAEVLDETRKQNLTWARAALASWESARGR